MRNCFLVYAPLLCPQTYHAWGALTNCNSPSYRPSRRLRFALGSCSSSSPAQRFEDDPAHYRWTSYRTNGLGQSSAILTPHPLYVSLGENDAARQEVYRALFRSQLDKAAVDDTWLALVQNQPLGNERFYARIEKLTGQRLEVRPQGRPRASPESDVAPGDGQGELDHGKTT